jgi:RNA polymerase-binding protein DksA
MLEHDHELATDTLLGLRKRLTRDVEMAEEALRDDVVSPGELSNLHTHPADQSVDGMDKQIAIAQNEEHLLEEVEAALERIEQGTYGTCLNCGRKIARERLEAIPYTPLCIDCARLQADNPR